MIQVESVAKAYAGQPILRDLSWRIPDRERIGLVGPNGAGKTTLCRLLAGVEEPDEGRIVRPGSRRLSAAGGGGPPEIGPREVLASFADGAGRARWKTSRQGWPRRPAPKRRADGRYGDLQHRLRRSATAPRQANAILSESPPPRISAPARGAPSGWRVRHARGLLLQLRRLLLDEPTIISTSNRSVARVVLADEGTVVMPHDATSEPDGHLDRRNLPRQAQGLPGD
jgi:ATPase subunit of ABC transporter with duplicated ATPase domains